ncbi:MAG: hydroxyphenylacetyl-CoA thioesterase PaaI [Candidatus Desulfofervidaceae bacterium]|nr:hydroxyphenylacetyl-CoA thioesterase PaaI [Candidatus Desulfofervidaceae bacterium]
MSDEKQMIIPKEAEEKAWEIARWMNKKDQIAVNFGMKVLNVKPGSCVVEMKVTEKMLNAVGITHGAVTYALADFAFAVASNSHGQVAVALNAQIHYPAPSKAGDILRATATEETKSRRTAIYRIEVKRADGTLVGLFTGTVFRRDDRVEQWMKD